MKYEVYHNGKLLGVIEGWHSAVSAKVSAARKWNVPFRELKLKKIKNNLKLTVDNQ